MRRDAGCFSGKAGDAHLRPGDAGTRDSRQHLYRGEGGGFSRPPHREIHRDHADPHPQGPGGIPPSLRNRRGRDHHAILKAECPGNGHPFIHTEVTNSVSAALMMSWPWLSEKHDK